MKAELIDIMGDDLRVVNAARVSMNKESDWEIDYGNQLKDKDAKLIKYLAKHNHFTPFTHCIITMRETVPIFVARQRFKHTVGFSYNEVSRRYVDDAPEFYIPTEWRARPENGIKQGSSIEVINELKEPVGFSVDEFDDPTVFNKINDIYQLHIKRCMEMYSIMLENNVAPEMARMVLPQSTYTSYYVTGSLAAWARAYNLRIKSNSQKEIQELAKQWDQIIRPHFPCSWSALTDE